MGTEIDAWRGRSSVDGARLAFEAIAALPGGAAA